jgi:AAA+ ATPase superfamily predicted ATPase
MSRVFIGRETELAELVQLQHRNVASMVIIQGRRRIGKSRLIEEFAKNQKFIEIVGLAPNNKITEQMQRDEFARQLCEALNLPQLTMQDWGGLFTFLANQTSKGKVVILLDEISWIGSLDPTFLPKLKNAWDKQFSKNPKLCLALCGSVSSWIEKNIVSNTLFLGRPSLYINLKELSLPECNQFFGHHEDRISAYEKLKILAVTGGVPKYLELISPERSAEENIRFMCFSPNSPLLDEFKRIFSDIFGKRTSIYRKIIQKLIQSPMTQEELFEKSERSKTGDFSEYLRDLELAGFVARDFTWNLKEATFSKLSTYRLKDNYTRFYLKYIHPNMPKIKNNLFQTISMGSLPAWNSIIALQFENLVLNNILGILKLLGIALEEILFANPYFQRKTKRQEACQIDLLIATKYNALYICEIKFSKSPLTKTVIEEMKTKLKKFKIPQNFSYRSVLIHVNGVQDSVVDEGFFSNMIDFGDLL